MISDQGTVLSHASEPLGAFGDIALDLLSGLGTLPIHALLSRSGVRKASGLRSIFGSFPISLKEPLPMAASSITSRQEITLYISDHFVCGAQQPLWIVRHEE
jgi:hypothetical protein